jgi:hypothetical protein
VVVSGVWVVVSGVWVVVSGVWVVVSGVWVVVSGVWVKASHLSAIFLQMGSMLAYGLVLTCNIKWLRYGYKTPQYII